MDIQESGSHKMPTGFDKEKTLEAVEALLKYASKTKANSLFADTPSRLLLDITTFKIPEGENHFYNIVLPNSPYPEQSDKLLVIPDDRRTAKDPEILVNNMKDKLREAEINIREVMTVTQLRDEYSTFEGKRKLAKRIDLVLSHHTVFKCLPMILGREFYKKKKPALSVDCSDSELTESIARALMKTVLNISLKGSVSTISVGHDNLTASELSDNVYKITNWIMRQFPGGFQNISKLSLYVAGVPPLIIYFSKGSRNDVKKSIIKGPRSRSPVEGELSTLPGRKVRVHPRGDIEVLSGDSSDNDDSASE